MVSLKLLPSWTKNSGLAEFLSFLTFVRKYFVFMFLKEVNAYLMAAIWSSKTIAESPGFSPVLKV